MADAKMNQKWWVGNKAKTLNDSGDTVSKALTAWDTAKAKADVKEVEAALEKLSKAAGALKGKCNKTLHKETIGYLTTYENNCKECVSTLAKADGTKLAKNMATIPKPILKELEALDPSFWISYGNSLEFLSLMKSGKGSLEIYKMYVKPGSKGEVNLPAKDQTACGVAATAADWEDPCWMAAVTTIKKLMKAAYSDAMRSTPAVEKRLQIAEFRTL